MCGPSNIAGRRVRDFVPCGQTVRRQVLKSGAPEVTVCIVSQVRSDWHGNGKYFDYASLVAISGDMTTVVDLNGKVMYCSPACMGAFGWKPDNLVGNYEADLVHPDDAPAMHAGRTERSRGPR